MKRELKQLEFIKSFRKDVIDLYLQNKNKAGYVSLYADKDFNPYGFNFNTEDFNISDFNLRKSDIDLKEVPISEIFYIYYKILWQDNKTKWSIKELVYRQ